MVDHEHSSIGAVPGLPNLRNSQAWLLDEFEVLLRKAKSKGIKQPLTLIDIYIDRRSLNDVKVFGLRAGILFTFLSPLVLYGFKLYCAQHKLDIDLHEQDIFNFCLINGGSVMAFGFGSGIHQIIQSLRKAPDNDDVEEIIFLPERDGDE